MAACLAAGASGCTPVTGTAVPVEHLTNQADLDVTVFVTPISATSFLQPESTIAFRFTPSANLLELTDVDLRGSNVHFAINDLIGIDATDIRVRQLPGGAGIVGVVDPLSGTVGVLADVQVEGSVYLDGAFVYPAVEPVTVALDGSFAYDASTGSAFLSDFHGSLLPVTFSVGPMLVRLAGELTFNFEGAAAPPAG